MNVALLVFIFDGRRSIWCTFRVAGVQKHGRECDLGGLAAYSVFALQSHLLVVLVCIRGIVFLRFTVVRVVSISWHAQYSRSVFCRCAPCIRIFHTWLLGVDVSWVLP